MSFVNLFSFHLKSRKVNSACDAAKYSDKFILGDH